MGKLVRSKNSVLAGVCAGVAEYFGLDAKLVRVVWALAAVFAGIGVLLYLILWLIIPAAQD
ncbi:MAG: PspC domain-containing protein [Bacteroidaceae bacterium]|nr:PspC domain-containing protein [Bacteroidaceae bacterium]MBR6649071.1 PspC domain-containing protein [Bacteroidaceae bacterium]